ncbi:ankyrin repeat protein [Teladorsagia circumcincta]|uniref:Ankyrin repeat protein n=1 Tax=Teladorsagia circumcincta TaxID=45464 RepID=A0A2G9TPL7_TELCI|nr:ankyrin repeat protein [Teladorsagia circumcincta]
MGNSPCVPKSKRVKVKANYSRTAAAMNSGRVIPELTSFVHLLPDMTRVDPKGQMELYHILYENSVRRPLHIENSTMRDRMEQAFEALCDEMQVPEISVLPELVGRSPEAIDEYLREHGLMAAAQDGPSQTDIDHRGDSLVDEDARNGANLDGLILLASAAGHVVKILLENGAQVNATTDETMETALTVAACGGFTEVLDVLVKNGGDLGLGTNTPLMEAAQEGHASTVNYILAAVKPEDRSVKFRQQMDQALSLASENGHFDVLQVLYSNGADLNFDYDGRTALMKAAKNGFLEIVEFLVAKGADVCNTFPPWDPSLVKAL